MNLAGQQSSWKLEAQQRLKEARSRSRVDLHQEEEEEEEGEEEEAEKEKEEEEELTRGPPLGQRWAPCCDMGRW